VLALVVGASLLLLHGRLLAGGFDRGAARSLGAAPAGTEAALLVLLALAIVVAVQGLGNLLVVAVFVGPAATARQLTERIGPMIGIAIATAVLAGLAGLYLSYYAGTAGGASVALAIVGLYLLSLPVSRLLALLNSEERLPAGATIGCWAPPSTAPGPSTRWRAWGRPATAAAAPAPPSSKRSPATAAR
jgi:ABC-type Mn2+/Zn2+ transport system permease subunit